MAHFKNTKLTTVTTVAQQDMIAQTILTKEIFRLNLYVRTWKTLLKTSCSDCKSDIGILYFFASAQIMSESVSVIPAHFIQPKLSLLIFIIFKLKSKFRHGPSLHLTFFLHQYYLEL